MSEETEGEVSASSGLKSSLSRRTLLGGAALALTGAALAACSTTGSGNTAEGGGALASNTIGPIRRIGPIARPPPLSQHDKALAKRAFFESSF